MKIARLGEFTVDLRTRRLRKNGRDVPLQEQPFRILEQLLVAPDHTLTREQLTAALWPAGTYVDFDRSLNSAMNKLRTALGESAESPRFIETIGRHAYRLLIPQSRVRPVVAAITATTAVALIAVLLAGFGLRSQAHVRSIAVLPLQNLSTAPGDAFLADGITDELITRLAQSEGLQVISRQSVLRYRSARLPLPKIASQLGVDAIIEGTVARNGNRLRVTAQLIDGRTDRHIWASSFEREISDVLALQSDIAGEVAERVGAKLSARMAAAPPNSDAYLLYLRGVYEWNKVPPNFDVAIPLFQAAIAKDPRFARAYAGLADCYGTRRWWNTTHSAEDAKRARDLALTALRLDPGLADAYTELASLADDEHDHATAEMYFRRALAANPRYVIAHQWYALHLARLRRFDESIREARIGVRLDPLSPYALSGLVLVLDLAGRFNEVIETRERMRTLFPERKWSAFETARQLRETGRAREAVGEVVRGLTSAGAATFAAAVRDEDRRNGADAALRLFLQRPDPSMPAWMTARFSALVHDRERALAALERSFAEGDNSIVYANAAPEFAFLRDDPRFRSLIAKMRLE